MNPPSGRHGQDQHHLVGSGAIGHAHFDGVVVAPHVRPIEVRQWNIEPSTHWANFLGRWNDRRASANGGAHSAATGNVPHGAVLNFADTTDDRAFAVTLNTGGVAPEVGDELASQLFAECAQLICGRREILDVLPNVWVADDRSDCALEQGHCWGGAKIGANFFDLTHDLANGEEHAGPFGIAGGVQRELHPSCAASCTRSGHERRYRLHSEAGRARVTESGLCFQCANRPPATFGAGRV